MTICIHLSISSKGGWIVAHYTTTNEVAAAHASEYLVMPSNVIACAASITIGLFTNEKNPYQNRLPALKKTIHHLVMNLRILAAM